MINFIEIIFITIFLVIKKIKINSKILKNILIPLVLNLCLYDTTFFWKCQEKLIDKIRQIMVEATIPATSAASVAAKIPLVFFIPTTLV